MALCREEKNLFTVRVHYHGRLWLTLICCIKLLDDIDDGGEYSISVNRASTELIKVSASKRAMLSAIPFNLGDNNDSVEVNENANDIEKGADVDDEGNEKDKKDVVNEEEENDFDYSDSEVHSDDSDDVGEPTGGTQPNWKQRKGPQMSTFEKSVFDGRVSEGQTQVNKKKRYIGTYARHGFKFKQRRLSGWVDSVLSDRRDMSDIDSGDSTSDNDGTIDVVKLTVTTRKKKKRYVHFIDKNMKNPRLFSGLIFFSSEQFKEVMKLYSLIRRKDIWLTCNESHR
ncbi:hypothetical protein LIER_34175 [Lithospermum erythrorhizon]|uniref:Uncharacterized protein n=1 Tax=Lithospermum erythrorhizon TaxID=34254 RepID=A0AAV3S2E8_LITER